MIEVSCNAGRSGGEFVMEGVSKRCVIWRYTDDDPVFIGVGGYSLYGDRLKRKILSGEGVHYISEGLSRDVRIRIAAIRNNEILVVILLKFAVVFAHGLVRRAQIF